MTNRNSKSVKVTIFPTKTKPFVILAVLRRSV